MIWVLVGIVIVLMAIGFVLGWYVRGAYTLRYLMRALRRRKERA